MSPLDRLVAIFSPQRAVVRARAREALRAYEAASPRDPWRPRRAGASAQADHLADAATLRAKARSLVQNVPYIHAAVRAKVADVVGAGVDIRYTGKGAEVLNQLLARWSAECDADGRCDLNGLVAQCYRAEQIDGEVLVRLRPRRIEDGLAVPLQLQVLEIDYLDSTRNSLGGSTPGTSGAASGNVIVEGIEYDALGRVAAYWLWDNHPGDVTLRRGLRTQSRRVPAASIIHLFDPQRPGQGRGFSKLASVIARARDTQLLEDAELARKNLESRLGVIYSGDASQMAGPPIGGSSADGSSPSAQGASRTGDLGELPSGGIFQVPAGGNITTVAPHPAPGHVDGVKFQIHLIAAAIGTTYEQVTGDMSEVNFTSGRMRRLSIKREIEQEQWLMLVPRLLNPIARAFASAAEDAGLVRSPDAACEYAFPKWDYTNPQHEVAADAAEVASGMASLSDKIRARGEKPERVFAQLEKDFAGLRASGVLDILLMLQKGKTMEQPQAAASSGAD